MATKANIFSALPQHHSDSEDEGGVRTKTHKTAQKGARQDNTKKTPGPSTGKEEHTRPKELRKEKGVSDQPHPLDRHSGTGQSAYGGKPKKQGAGKGNWGSYKDEKRPGQNVEGREGEADEGVVEGEPTTTEEKPSLTLQEYYQQRNFGKGEQQINEAKAKITSAQLMKEMGTATLLKGRHQLEVDDRKAGKKKDHLNADHRAAIATEHADLLGFRTGFIEKEYKQRTADEGSPRKPGQGGPKGNTREPREQENAKEEEVQPAAQPEGTQVEGQGEGQQDTKGQGEERRRPEGGRGGQRGGDRARGGNRPQGERRPQGGKPGNEAAKINFDESAFPKLG